LVVLRILLGFILLAEVSIVATYHNVLDFDLLTSGLSPLNSTFAADPTVRLEFWFNYPSFLINRQYVVSADPIACSGMNCSSYFCPGGLPLISLVNQSNFALPLEYYPDAEAVLQWDAPGYQIEFDSTIDGLELSLNDCTVYGDSKIAIVSCVRQLNSSLIIGIVPTEVFT